MDEEREQGEPQDDVKLPEERVEDLEPEAEESADVAGGKLQPSSFKPGELTLKRGAG